MIDSKSDLYSSISELGSLGLETPKLNESNDFYQIGNLVDSLRLILFVDTNRCPYSLIGWTPSDSMLLG